MLTHHQPRALETSHKDRPGYNTPSPQSVSIYKHSLLLVIQALVALVNDPEPEHPLRGDLAEEYTKDKSKFNKTAEEYTVKYAEKRP